MRSFYKWFVGGLATLAVSVPLVAPYFKKTPQMEIIPSDPVEIIYYDVVNDGDIESFDDSKFYPLGDRIGAARVEKNGNRACFDPSRMRIYTMPVDWWVNREREEAPSEDTIKRISEIAMENIVYRQKAQRLYKDVVDNGNTIGWKSEMFFSSGTRALLSGIPFSSRLISFKIMVEKEWQNHYRFDGKPVTVLVSDDRKTMDVFNGELDFRDQPDIESDSAWGFLGMSRGGPTFSDSGADGALSEVDAIKETERYRKFLDGVVLENGED